MMMLVQADVLGRVERQRTDGRRAKDRLAVVQYGRCRDQLTPGHLSCLEQWVLDKDRFIGECVQDDPATRALPPHERPGLVLLGALSVGTPGGVLVERLSDLGEDEYMPRAVICQFLTRSTTQSPLVWYRDRRKIVRVSSRQVADWRAGAGETRVTEAFVAYRDAVGQHLKERLEEIQRTGGSGFDSVLYLGSGPIRDKALAKSRDQQLRENGWSDAAIRRYLALYGYINPSGTVGRWSHEQLWRLRAQA